MIFLPIAFYCTVTGICVFTQGQLTTDLDICTAQNQGAEQQFKMMITYKHFKQHVLL